MDLREQTRELSKEIINNENKLKIEKEIINIKNQYEEDIHLGKIRINGIEFIPDFCLAYFLCRKMNEEQFKKKIKHMREFLKGNLTSNVYRQTFKVNSDYLFVTSKQLLKDEKRELKKLEKIKESIESYTGIDKDHIRDLNFRKEECEAYIEELENLTINSELMDFLINFREEIGKLNGINLERKTTKGRKLTQAFLYNEEGIRKYLSYARFDNTRLDNIEETTNNVIKEKDKEGKKQEYKNMPAGKKYWVKRCNNRKIFLLVEDFYKKVFNKKILVQDYLYCVCNQAVKINDWISEYSQKLFEKFSLYSENDNDLKSKYYHVNKEMFSINFREYAERVILKNKQYSYMTTPYNNFKAFRGLLNDIDKFIENNQYSEIIKLFELVNIIAKGSRLELKQVKKLVEHEVVNRNDRVNKNNLLNQYTEMENLLNQSDVFKGTLRYKKEAYKNFNEVFLSNNEVIDINIDIFRQFKNILSEIEELGVDYFSLKYDYNKHYYKSKEIIGMKYLDYCELKYKVKNLSLQYRNEYDTIKELKTNSLEEQKEKMFKMKDIMNKYNEKCKKIFVEKSKECKKHINKLKIELDKKYFQLYKIVDTMKEYVDRKIENKVVKRERVDVSEDFFKGPLDDFKSEEDFGRSCDTAFRQYGFKSKLLEEQWKKERGYL